MKKSKKIIMAVVVIAVVVIGVFILSHLENETENSNTNNNLLMVSELKEAPVMNGFGDEQIGTYAYIELSEPYFNKLTPDNFAQFAKEKVKDSGYNYVTIKSSDGTGAFWAASNIEYLEFGKLNENNMVTDETAVWQLVNDKYEDITEQWEAEQAELDE